ncbi:MAG: hypothetical protein ACTSRH_06990 [Promethearchaeota archaeon]
MSEPKKEEKLERKEPLHVRYDWLDQFRGLVIIFLVISVITWPLTGNIVTGNPPWIGPPLLNHGFQYYKGYPAMITIIDIGQQIFMFVLGYVGYIAFTSRREKKGTWAAWKHGLIRVGILYALALLDDGIIGGLIFKGNFPLDEVLYKGTLANLAIGSFAAYLGTYLIPKSADKRIYLAIGIMITHAILYFLPGFDHYGPVDGPLIFPWNAFNHAGIAIAGTCFSQWYKKDPNNPDIGFKKRILPAATLSIILFYCFDWIQPAEHHDATTSLALLSIGVSGFLISIFYSFEKLNFKLPILSEMGRNLLLLFIIAFVFDLYIGFLADHYRTFLVEYPVVTMLICGILPIVIEAGIALLLAKKNIIVKI